MSLTFATGLVDAASFLGLGRIFTANMTGNIVFIGFSIAGAPGLSFNGQVSSLIAFAAGAALAGRFCSKSSAAPNRGWLLKTALLEAVLLFAAAVVAMEFVSRQVGLVARSYTVVVLTALAMGWRTAIVRRLAVPDLVTTVLTLTLTGLAAESSLAGGDNPRFGRRLCSLAVMFAGAISGALLLRLGLAAPLAASGLCALIAAGAYVTLPASET